MLDDLRLRKEVRPKFAKNIFILFLFLTNFTISSAQATTSSVQPATIYSNTNLQPKANELCQRYTSRVNVFGDPSIGGSGGSVPVDFSALRDVLISIDKNTRLSANELRQDNLLKFCDEYQNMAAASKRLAEQSAKQLKTLADNCYADERCLRKRVFETDIQSELEKSYPLYDREIKKLVLKRIESPALSGTDKYNYADIEKCAKYFDAGFTATECLNVPKPSEVIVKSTEESLERIRSGQANVSAAFKDGVMGSRPCIKATDGGDPSDIPWYDRKRCAEWKQEPILVNQEALKQITALPYTQAFSPSAVLGNDEVLGNISTRVREGNLIDANISTNFSSSNSGGGNANVGTDLASLEANYNKLNSNLDVIIKLFDVANLAYSSSTSVCKSLPVATRAVAIEKINSSKKTYVDYKVDLQKKWEDAKVKNRESLTPLIVQINFDLREKFNQASIDKVYEAVKALLQTCVDASTAPSS